MKPSFSTIAAAGLFVAALATTGCNRHADVASINGEGISQAEYYEYLATKPSVVVMASGRAVELPVDKTLGFQALQDLVVHKLVVQLAREQKLEPTEKDVDDEIAYRSKLDTGFITALKNRGISMASIRSLVKTELCQFRLQTQGVTLQPDEVDKYIAANKDKFVSPEKVEVYWILAKDDAKRAQIDKELQSGGDFKTVARKLSDAEGAAQNDGLYPSERLDQFPVTARTPVSQLTAGQTSPWIKGEQGEAKFLLASKVDSKPIELTAERREQIRRQLLLERGSKSNDLGQKIADKVQASTTDIGDAGMKDLWTQFEQKIKDQARTAKLSSALPTTPAP